MEYLLLIATDETSNPDRGTPEFDAWMAAWMEFNQQVMARGQFIAGAGLQRTDTATTLRKSSGAKTEVVDGPFAETKEQLGGFYLITAADLDEALTIAESLPIPNGSIEVRPLSFRPSA
jgi:hypothetical protein